MQFTFVLGILIPLAFFTVLNSHQISAQNSTFVTYRNSSLGFSIEHPRDWPLVNETLSDERQVMFKPPDSIMPTFVVRIADLTPYLDTDTMTVKNKTLDKVVQEYRTNISNPKPNLLGIEMEFRLIRENQVIVGGNPGWKFEMTMSVGPENDRGMYAYFYFVLTVVNGKLYSLEYDEKPLKVPETLPIANKMLESFRIIPIEPLNTSSVKTNLTEDITEETIKLSSDTPAKQGYASMTVYNITQNSTAEGNDTLGYTSLYERTTDPRTFTPEQQAAIDAKCKTLKDMYLSLPTKDRNWYLSNC